jgi:hypothetical protein
MCKDSCLSSIAEIQTAENIGNVIFNCFLEIQSISAISRLLDPMVIKLKTSCSLLAVEVMPSGYDLHWESLNMDLAVPALLAGLYGTQAWMTELGRRGGQAKSTAKAEAARENGKKGG